MRLLTSIRDPPYKLYTLPKKAAQNAKNVFCIFIRFLCIFVYIHVQYYIIYKYCTLLCVLCKMYINVKLVLKNVFSLRGVFFVRTFALSNNKYNILNTYVMKTKKERKNVNIKDVRNDFKAQTGSLNYCLKVIYSAIEEAKENDRQVENLKKIMPKSKKEAYEFASDIAKFGKVGEIYTVTRNIKAQQTTYEITRKPSIDMILKYFTKKANGEI